jgi:hypothetical protein
MVAPVSSSRAPHDGFAVLVVLILIVAAGLAGYWYAQQGLGGPARADAAVEKSG